MGGHGPIDGASDRLTRRRAGRENFAADHFFAASFPGTPAMSGPHDNDFTRSMLAEIEAAAEAERQAAREGAAE